MESNLNSVYLPLRLTFGLVPIAAGADKFTNMLADWAGYLPSFAGDLLPVSPAVFMGIVGVIEIIAGLVVLTGMTRLGGYIVMLWLTLIAVNVAVAGHLDIAVRDLVMAVGAFTLAQVSAMRGEPLLPTSWPPTQAKPAHAG
ncbi:MAG: DoxX family membrane protein [Phycisphaerales bacterium]